MHAPATDDPITEALSSPPSFLNPRLRLLHQTPGPAQESSNVNFTPVAGPSSVVFSDTSVVRLRTLLAHPPSSPPNGRYSFVRRGGKSFGMSEMDITPVVYRAREWQKDRRESLGGNEDDGSNIKVSPPSSILRESGSSVQTRALVSTSVASPHSVPDSPLKFAGSEGEGQTMPPSSTHGTPSLTSCASQDGPEVERLEADAPLVRVGEDSFAYLNYTTMKTPRPPGAWSLTPIPLKHAPRVTSPPSGSSSELTPTAPSSWMPFSRTNLGPEWRSRSEATAGNDLFTPIHTLSRTESLHVRTPVPPGTWMSSTTTQNWSNEQSKFGSIRTKQNILKVRFDVTESESSTAEVEHQVPRTITDMPMFAPNFLLDGHASRSGKVPKTRINGSSQGDAVDDLVLDRPVIPEHHMAPTSCANPSSSRSQRKTFSVKVVDTFGREMIDELPVAIANGQTDAGDAICASLSAETRTPRVSSKNEIRIIDTRGAEVQEDVLERPSMTLRDGPPICRTAAPAQIRQTLREWASGLSDEDR